MSGRTASIQQKSIRGILSLLVLTGMGCASYFLHEDEIIFPETLALLTGAWIVREMPWNVKHGQLTFVMTLAAAMGLCISRYIPLPLFAKVVIALGATFALLYFAKTAMSPAVSACVLPVMLHTTSWVYLTTVVCLVGIIDVGRLLMERCSIHSQTGIISPKQYTAPDKSEWKLWLLRFAVISLFVTVPLLLKFPYFVVPPVLVAFVAMSDPKRKEKHHPVRLSLLFFACGLVGTMARLVCVERIGVVEPAMIAITGVAVWAMMKLTKRYFPPAGAAAKLPFILPKENLWVYPLEESAGILIMFCAAQVVFFVIKIWKKNKEKRIK